MREVPENAVHVIARQSSPRVSRMGVGGARCA
jgi:hypothetical protein